VVTRDPLNVVLIPIYSLLPSISAGRLLHGFGTLSCHIREEHRLGAYENTVLNFIFGPKREKVARGWRRLHNEELHNLYTSQNITATKWRRVTLVGHVACMGELRISYRILVGTPEG
jgi:hypothetical protein